MKPRLNERIHSVKYKIPIARQIVCCIRPDRHPYKILHGPMYATKSRGII